MKFKRTTIIVVTLAAFLVGIALGRSGLAVDLALLAPALVLAVIGRRSRMLVLAVAIIGLTMGIWRGQQSVVEEKALTGHIGQKVLMTGQAATDPVHETQWVDFDLDHLKLNGRAVGGTIHVKSYYVRVQRGYRLSLDGKLSPGFGAKPAEMAFAKINVTSMSQNSLERWRQRFLAGIHTALPDPLAGFGLGLLVGTRALIPKWLQAQLAIVGLSHLVAVSGYNLTIIVQTVNRLVGKRGKFLAAALSAWIIAGFMVVTGFSPSVVRAAIVAGLVILSAYYGRRIKPLVLIALAAAITAALNPASLVRDLGWQLSFLAFFGIIVLAPAMTARFIKRPNAVKLLAVETLSAQLMTFPLIMLRFGTLSIVAPLANLLVLPLVPAAMLTSFAAGLAGMLVPALSGWLALPAYWLLKLMLSIVFQLAAWPQSSLKLGLTPAVMIALYGLIIAGLVVVRQRLAVKGRRWFEDIDDPADNQQPQDQQAAAN